MKLSEIAGHLDCELVHSTENDFEIEGAYTSDLLSDVMAHAPANSILVTIQSHRNTIAVATVADVRAVLVCNDRPVPEDMIEAAKEEGVAILRTARSQFESSGLIFCRFHGIAPPAVGTA
jgi:hypothetical protein